MLSRTCVLWCVFRGWGGGFSGSFPNSARWNCWWRLFFPRWGGRRGTSRGCPWGEGSFFWLKFWFDPYFYPISPDTPCIVIDSWIVWWFISVVPCGGWKGLCFCWWWYWTCSLMWLSGWITMITSVWVAVCLWVWVRGVRCTWRWVFSWILLVLRSRRTRVCCGRRRGIIIYFGSSETCCWLWPISNVV